MSQVEVDKIIPQSGTTLTIGDSGDTVNFADGTSIGIDTNTLYIDSTNNRVGIGTTSPSEKLEVSDGKLLVKTTSGASIIEIVSPGGTADSVLNFGDTADNNVGVIAYEHDNNAFRFLTNASEAMRINSSGKVGIGTSSPDRALEISGSSNTASTLRLKNTAPDPDNIWDFVAEYNSGDIKILDDGTERMRINSSGNVGIGTSSPERTLDVSGDMRISDTGVNTGLRITVDTNREAYLVFGDTSDATMAGIAYDNSTNALTVDANNAERMRIDSSGNFMVGKTSANTNTAGFEIIPAGRIGVTRSGNITAMFNRLSSDGEIVRFQKDGTTVGTIGTAGGSIYIGNSSSKGVFFTNGATVPGTSGSGTDNTFDLGTSSSRWKDLYLGGGAFIGGTDTAHKLDDYEEGDWTPSYTAASGTPVYNVRAGSYTKVGRKVTVTGAISAARGSLSGDVTISGLPFSCSSATKFSNSVSLMGEDWNSTFSFKGRVQNNNNVIQLYKEATNTAGFVGVNQGDMKTSAAQDNFVQFTVTYTAA